MIMAKRLSTANVRKTNPLLQCWKLLAASAVGNGQQTGLVEVFELNLLLKYISLVTFTHTHPPPVVTVFPSILFFVNHTNIQMKIEENMDLQFLALLPSSTLYRMCISLLYIVLRWTASSLRCSPVSLQYVESNVCWY